METSFVFDSVLTDGAYDREYSSEDFCQYFASFISNGVFPNPSDNLQVVEVDNLDIAVLSGRAFLNGRTYRNEGKLIFTLDVADGVLNRKDSVIVQVNHLKREIKTVIKKGTYAVKPLPPALVRNADFEEIQLAEVTIKAGTLKITDADIDDTRHEKDLCGIVSQLVQTVDTTTLFNQYKSWYEQTTDKAVKDLEAFQRQFREDIIAWADNLKSALDENTAINLFNKIDEVNTTLSTQLSEQRANTYTKAESDMSSTYTLLHSKLGTTHTLADLPNANGIYQCQFVATADYNEGDTFGGYTAKPTGEEQALPDKAFVTGDLVSVLVDSEGKKLGFKLGGGGANDTLPSLPVFSLSPKATSTVINFTELSSTDYPYLQDYVFVYKTGGNPKSYKDGTAVVIPKKSSGSKRSFEVTGLKANTIYYFRVFTRNQKKQIQTMLIEAFQNIKVGYEKPYTLAPLSVARWLLTSSPLADGVGVFGGTTSNKTRVETVDFYDKNKVRTTITSMSETRGSSTSSPFADGVGIFGGLGYNYLKTADFYNRNKVKSALEALSVGRAVLTSSPLADGVGVFGGRHNGYFNVVDFYNKEKVRTTLTPLSVARDGSTSSPLADGVGVFGGSVGITTEDRKSTVDFYDKNKVRTTITSMSVEKTNSTSSPLADGVGIFGGLRYGRSDVVDFYNKDKVRTTLIPLSVVRDELTSSPLADGVGVFGGDGVPNSDVVDFYPAMSVDIQQI